MIVNGRANSQAPNVAGSVSDLTHDVIELAELQTQLLMLDLKKTTQRTRTCLVLCVLGVCLLLGTIPVALYALAALLVEQFGWPASAGYGVATLVGLVVSGILLAAGWYVFRQGLVSLQRSRDELRHNVTWVKSALRSRGQAEPTKAP